MKLLLLLAAMIMLIPFTVSAANFKFQKVKGGVYAAIAEPGGKAASNSLVIVTGHEVIVAGSHFVQETTKELLDFVQTITALPVHYFILTHHHRGFNHIDFDLPVNAEIIVSGPTWQALKSEFRQIKNRVIFFDRGLTMKQGNTLIVMNATEKGHAEGDVFVFLPEEGVLFTSDLFFNDVVGYMGDATFRDWIGTVEILSAIDVNTVVPGLGPVSNTEGIVRFQTFFREFTTEVLRLINKGLDVEPARRQFSLSQYENIPGFKTFFDVNFRRAYNELKVLK